jgi:signal transduction histidine kinase/CheY-like chemotaxis protein
VSNNAEPISSAPAEHPAPRRGLSLVAKLVLSGSALVAGTVALFAWIWWQTEREQAEREWRGTLEHEARLTAVRMQAFVAEAGHDARFLASAPVVMELANGNAAARGRVTDTFRALLRGKPAYVQVRLILRAEGGPELVRLNQSGGVISVTPDDQLQQKGDRDYIRDSESLAPGQVFFSDMDLNRDFGVITEPYEPTLRAVAQVHRSDGGPFGWVVINADLRPLLSELEDHKTPGLRLYVANGAGSWLVHPRPEARFGKDLGTGWNVLEPSEADRAEFGEDYLSREQAWPFAEHSGRQFRVRAACREASVLQGLAHARRQAFTAAGVAALAGILGMALFAWWTMRRLHRVAEALRKFQHGEPAPQLPEEPRDEAGELAAAFNRMSARITEQVNGLDAARREADAAARAKEDFLGVMAHEVRTPLNAVTGLLRVLERNHPAPHQEPVLRSLRAATTNLTGLLNDALDWSRVRAGKFEFRSEVFAPRELLTQLELTHRPLAAQKGLSWHSDFTGLPAAVSGDAARLRQILGNLLSNAVKFTDSGSIGFLANWKDGLLVCTVQDSGIGIREEDIGRIFSPFDQASGEIGRRFGGTGLGLSITRSLAEGMGGTLTAASAGAGAGSCFTLTLPSPAADATVAAAPSGAPPSLAGRRILIVEDSPAGREVLTAVMEETGAVLAVAEDGAAAERILRDGEPLHAALLDLQLPDTDGFTLARLAGSLRSDLPMLAVTAQVNEATRQSCQESGLRALVPKPVEPAVLFAALRKHLPGAAAGASWPQLFADEPTRRQRVFHALADEFEEARHALADAVRARDSERIRRLRHQLHTALTSLQLDSLRAALEHLIAGRWDHHPRADAAIAEVLTGIRRELADV